jgi:SHS2 domain-containing protein
MAALPDPYNRRAPWSGVRPSPSLQRQEPVADPDETLFPGPEGAEDGADDVPVPGVRGLEHTADVGLEVEAPDLPELFRRAALGATWLVLEGEVGEGVGEVRLLEITEEDLPSLLRSWLRFLLFWLETESFAVTEAALSFAPAPLCSSSHGQAFGLRARVVGRTHAGPSVREIKGVTLHGLEVEKREGGWCGRVIFDV